MGFHVFDADDADKLERAEWRYQYLSREELLWALSLSSSDIVADLGSGTGFFTDDIAPYADTVHAVDLQEEMATYYEEKGTPENVELLTRDVADLPFEDGSIDVALSTMTFHEIVSEESLAEINRVLASNGRFVIVDWDGNATGDAGPPIDERYTLDSATERLRDNGFEIDRGFSRENTFLVRATA